MKFRHQVYKRFLTRRKLFSPAWNQWNFALIIMVGLGFLFSIVEIFKMHDRKIAFFNIRTVTLKRESNEKISNQEIFDNNSPVFVFSDDKVLFGGGKNVIAPMPGNDVLLFDLKNWKQEFNDKIANYKYYNKIFPATNVGILFKKVESYENQTILLKDSFDLIANQNKFTNKLNSKIYPSVILLDSIPSGEL